MLTLNFSRLKYFMHICVRMDTKVRVILLHLCSLNPNPRCRFPLCSSSFSKWKVKMDIYHKLIKDIHIMNIKKFHLSSHFTRRQFELLTHESSRSLPFYYRFRRKCIRGFCSWKCSQRVSDRSYNLGFFFSSVFMSLVIWTFYIGDHM